MNRRYRKGWDEWLLRRNKESVFIGNQRIEGVKTQKSLGKLFGEFKMEVDVVLHASGGTYLLDTKYKVLGKDKDHGGLSQPDFYQMYAYARSRKIPYDGVILLYPRTGRIVTNHDFTNENDGARLFVRFVDAASVHAGKGRVDEEAIVAELNGAFRDIEAEVSRSLSFPGV